MEIILTHIADKNNNIPPYTIDCISQARKFNPTIDITFLSNKENLDKFKYIFKQYNVKSVDYTLYEDDRILEFENLKFFENNYGALNHIDDKCDSDDPKWQHLKKIREYYGYLPNCNFWKFTFERLFYLASYMKKEQIFDVIHFENDVVIYENFDKLKTYFNNFDLAFTQVKPKWMTTGMSFIKKGEYLDAWSDFVLFEMKERKTPDNFISHWNYKYPNIELKDEMFNEMNLLNLFRLETGKIKSLNILPVENIFDGLPLGQYVGGTYQGHPPRVFKDGFIGEYLNTGYDVVFFEEEDKKIPYLIKDYKKVCKIYNLHMQGKQLKTVI